MAGELKAPTLAPRVEKPPVPSVAKVWQRASKKPIPAKSKRTNCKHVSPKYINHNILAVWVIFAVTLPLLGPVVSLLIRRKPPTPKRGKRATVKATIPIPPSQCIWHLHTWIVIGQESTSCKIVEPVVVKPETDSKTASLKEGITPEKKRGNAPSSPVAIHASATKTMPPRVDNTILLLSKKNNIVAMINTTNIGIKKEGIK